MNGGYKSHLPEAEVWGETTLTTLFEDSGSFSSARMLAAETFVIAVLP